MKTPDTNQHSRLERELARELEQRHRNDEVRAGILNDDDLRYKDARESNSSGHLQRNRLR